MYNVTNDIHYLSGNFIAHVDGFCLWLCLNVLQGGLWYFREKGKKSTQNLCDKNLISETHTSYIHNLSVHHSLFPLLLLLLFIEIQSNLNSSTSTTGCVHLLLLPFIKSCIFFPTLSLYPRYQHEYYSLYIWIMRMEKTERLFLVYMYEKY